MLIREMSFTSAHTVPRTMTVFTDGDCVLKYVNNNRYLGLSVNEYLDLNVTAKTVAQSSI